MARRVAGTGPRIALLFTALACTWLPGAFAAFPERPIKVLVPFPPGGAVDVVSRVVCAEVAEILGKPVIVENRAGAGGIIATDATAKAPADGYTLLVTTPSHTINPALRPKMPYDTERDLRPVALVANIPEVFVAHPAAPFDSFDGFVKYAKANPGKLNYASAGNGTLPHVTMELLLRRAQIEVAHVAYKGAAPAMTDLLAGTVQLKMDTYATSAPHVSAGRLRALAVASTRRLPQWPDVPTIAESGFPGYEGNLWIGVLAPAGTPREAIDTLAAAFAKAVRNPKVVQRLTTDGVEVVGAGPDDMARVIAKELPLWSKLVRDAKITASD